MIGVNIRGANFRGAQNYIFAGKNGTRLEPERVAWVHLRNLPLSDPHKAAALMQATASQNPRVQKPVEHIILNPPPGMDLSRRAMREIADRTLRDLGLGEHQAVVVEHHDLERRHLHILVNRVHPETLKAWDPSYSKRAMNRSLDRQARERGLPEVRRRETASLAPSEDFSTVLSKGAYQKALRAHREPFADLVRERAKAAMLEATSWDDLSRRLGREGLVVEARGAGLVVTDTHEVAKASSIDRAVSRRRLEERFGEPFAGYRERAGETLGNESRTALVSLRKPLLDLPTTAARADRLLDRLAATQTTFDEATLRRHSFWDKEGKALYRAALESDRLRRFETPGGTVLTTREGLSRLRGFDRTGVPPVEVRVAPQTERTPVPGSVSEGPAVENSHRAEALVERLAHHQAVFTRADLAALARREGQGAETAELALGTSRLVELRRDANGVVFYTTPDYLAAERNLFQAANELVASHGGPWLPESLREARLTENRHNLSGEQQEAVRGVTGDQGLDLLSGRAGTGKSRLFREVSDLYEEAGYRVRGAALSGAAAENLGRSADVESRTLASLEASWQRGRDRLTPEDVLIVDEAGMVGTRQMVRVLEAARDAQAKVILAGDENQLRPIEAGEPFRGLLSEHGGARLETIRRQRVPWQAEASVNLAEGRIDRALAAYDNAGRVEWYPTREAALRDLVLRYREDALAAPEETRLALAYRRADAKQLNREIREARHEIGQLGESVALENGRFAPADRILFLENDHRETNVRTLAANGDPARGVKNGSFATIVSVAKGRLEARLDSGRVLSFNPTEYSSFGHGYAATVHKAQGATVDRVYFVPDKLIERDAAYVALTRHARDLSVHVDRKTFSTPEKLATHLAREPLRDLARDHRSVADLEELAGHQQRRAELQRELDRLTRGQGFQALSTEEVARNKARSEAFRNRFREELATVFREPVRAEQAIERAMRTQGTAAAVRGLAARPERFGGLKGRGGLLPTRDRKAARDTARSAARSLEQWTASESRETARERPSSGRSLRSSISLARSAKHLVQQLSRIPSEEVLSKAAKRALWSLGAVRVAQAVPTPVYLAAIAVSTVRSATRDIGRDKGLGARHEV